MHPIRKLHPITRSSRSGFKHRPLACYNATTAKAHKTALREVASPVSILRAYTACAKGSARLRSSQCVTQVPSWNFWLKQESFLKIRSGDIPQQHHARPLGTPRNRRNPCGPCIPGTTRSPAKPSQNPRNLISEPPQTTPQPI